MTLFILIITIVISLMAFQSHEIYSKLIFNPYRISRENEWWRFLSSGFIHADWIHLAVNMYVLYQFGRITELYYDQVFEAKGWYYFLLLYLGGILISDLPTYKRHKDDYYYNGLGASGAVSAVLFSFILFNPMSPMGLFFVLEMPAIVFAILYLAYCYYMDRKGGDNVNHNAHLWGALFGIIYTIALKPSLVLNFYDQLTSGR